MPSGFIPPWGTFEVVALKDCSIFQPSSKIIFSIVWYLRVGLNGKITFSLIPITYSSFLTYTMVLKVSVLVQYLPLMHLFFNPSRQIVSHLNWELFTIHILNLAEGIRRQLLSSVPQRHSDLKYSELDRDIDKWNKHKLGTAKDWTNRPSAASLITALCSYA